MNTYSLRVRKRAKQKLALMNEFVRQLEFVKLHDIIIKNVCHAVEISEGTFYNYFPKKSDVIRFFRDLQFVKMRWELHNVCKFDNVFDKIVFSFEALIASMLYPSILYEFISVIISEDIKSHEGCVSEVELVCAFPDCEGIARDSRFSLHVFFEDLIRGAINSGELPKNICVFDVVKSIFITFGGVIFCVEERQFDRLKQDYIKHLKLVWAGLKKEEI